MTSLNPALQSEFPAPPAPLRSHSEWYVSAMEKLVGVVQELSHARDMEAIMSIVRLAARELTGADGATFVLRDGEQCHYAEENAISPLWKGKRFPLSKCISGWVMLNAESAMIEDIYSDPRIPADAYRPTFVKSLAMVPIRKASPIGAIGNYWAINRIVTKEELALLQALADTTSVALENVQLYNELQSKIKALQDSNYDLSRFAWVASHDLQEPLRTIVTQVELLQRQYGDSLEEKAKNHIRNASHGARRLQNLIHDLLVHAHEEKAEKFRPLAIAHIVKEVMKDLDALITDSKASIQFGELPWVWGDPIMLSRMFQNLISNAIKFQRPGVPPVITIDHEQRGDDWVIWVEDNGIGIDPSFYERVFGLFQRLNPQDEFPGSGIGLATCKKIVSLHEGRIWMENAQSGQGTRVCFSMSAKTQFIK